MRQVAAAKVARDQTREHGRDGIPPCAFARMLWN